MIRLAFAVHRSRSGRRLGHLACALLGGITILAPSASADITLIGTVRDFLPYYLPSGTYNGNPGVGHPDFESATQIYGDTDIVTSTLGSDHRPVYKGGSFTTSGATNFYQWFNDTPGVNVSAPLALTLSPTADPRVVRYSSTDFFPIDGQLFADSACCGHNYSFTFALHSYGYYAGGEVLQFGSDDDMFVYINGQLVVNMGGIHPIGYSSVNLDSLGLAPNSVYDIDVFFAERETTGSGFTMETSVYVPEPSSIVLLASIAGWLGIAARRRMTSRP